MNAMRLVMLVLMFSLACSGQSGGDDELAADGLRPSASSGKADGVSSEEYFAQFRYEVDETGGFYDSGQPKRTLMAATFGSPELYVDTEEGSLHVGASVWMLDDGRAYLEYAELQTRGSQSLWINDRIVLTRWRVEGDELILDDVGRAIASERDGLPTLSLTFTNDVVSPGLIDGSVTLWRVRTSSYIGHVERDYEYQEG